MSGDRVYLDYAATTPLDQRAIEAMPSCFRVAFGNPSSVYRWGQKADAAVEQARRDVADVLRCQTDEVVFTSGDWGSNILARRGAAMAARATRGATHILTTPVHRLRTRITHPS